MNGGKRGMHVSYLWESQRNRPLGRPRHRRVNNIKMDHIEIGLSDLD
jgi:hypothetical protein